MLANTARAYPAAALRARLGTISLARRSPATRLAVWRLQRLLRRPSRSPALLMGVLLAAWGGGCARHEEKSILSEPIEERTALQSGIGVPSAAVEAIAQRRCDLAQRCGQVGPGKRYDRRLECVFHTRAEWSEELNDIACPRGVHEGRLNTCLRELESETCDQAHALLRRPNCLAAAVCASGPTPPAVRPPISYEPER